MKHFGTILGTAIAGMFVMSVWGKFADAYGIGGGWFAGFIIIGTMWFLNHYVGIHNNDGAWVDMALGIGVAGTMRGVFESGIEAGIASLPTLGVAILGGIAGGYAAYMLEVYLAKKAEAEA
ncbi:Lin0368 family putative glycerol transporter subunit [Wukongibacter sp. M2B1]|uniref:Lin0368 family putative glycerol transporter subunit n=1 Tax=Wukongibacter sp. M2B1 TaxID=3088895 RepID=UPI003D7A3365